ncbi:hypothetical protein [Spiroplasma ixodetis]|uniref:hypothetical protein n=1 Tax=Spiroplasma ixodetis TaxID=2141 RepID=UPI002575E843|nr:hypothetical protein [Spiroplasma ixodetis]
MKFSASILLFSNSIFLYSICLFKIIKAFLPLCTIFKFYHINVEKSLSTDFSPHF